MGPASRCECPTAPPHSSSSSSCSGPIAASPVRLGCSGF
uniref:Uncharacterized protein n=1 Tax=Arundo donax TaxID=35708 RepID=A0A0A9DYZ4_ARUDO